MNLTFNATGAAEAGRRGDIVIIVDVIDMSTSAEVALENGAVAIYGAAPVGCKVSVNLNPERMGYLAGKTALKNKTGLVVVAEPRYGTEEERKKRAEVALQGVLRSGVESELILPNVGTEIGKLTDFAGKVVLFVSDTGGVAFDAAYNSGSPMVLTGTVVRTGMKKGIAPAQEGVQRAMDYAAKFDCNISVVAASANSMEDVLAADFLTKLIIGQGFLES